MCQTGNGTTVTLSVTTGTFRVIEISEFDVELPMFEDDDLSSTGAMPMCEGDLKNYAPVPMTLAYTDQIDWATEVGKEQVLTVQTPALSGQTTGAKYEGTGVINRLTHPARRNNERLEGGIEFTFKNGYTYTAAVPTP